MTIHLLGLSSEVFRLSDRQHSQLVTQSAPTFTLADGEDEFCIEQLSSSPPHPRCGWGFYLLGQILTAIPRALPVRQLIYQRCNPIMLTAKVTITPSRYQELTLFFTPGGYSRDIHTFMPPKLEGDRQLTIQLGRYTADPISVERAIREETMSQIGNYVNLFAIPLLLLVLFFWWLYRVLFHIAICLFPILSLFCLYFWKKSQKAKADLREKVNDTLRYLNGDL